MALKKYYGVKAGRVPGVYHTWAECQQQVIGHKGALFKSFPTESEALVYVTGTSAKSEGNDGCIADAPSGGGNGRHYDIYVDGSYEHKQRQYSWAFVVYDGKQLIHTASGLGQDADAAATRNVAGELAAAVAAVTWAQAQAADLITIHHDYIGISEWATGKWKTNNRITQHYAQFISAYLGWVRFNKVAGHSGVEGNELADKLAGEALKSSL